MSRQYCVFSETYYIPPNIWRLWCWHKIVQMQSMIAYNLKMDGYHKAITKRFVYDRQNYWHAINKKLPQKITKSPADIKQNYLHSKDGQMPHDHQVLHMSNRITYCLKNSEVPQNHHQEVLHIKQNNLLSRQAYSIQLLPSSAHVKQNYLHTKNQADATAPLPRSPAHVKQNHLLPR